MGESSSEANEEHAPGSPGPPREARYSLREMLAEVKEERRGTALGRELVDATEIKKMFGARKRKRQKDASE